MQLLAIAFAIGSMSFLYTAEKNPNINMERVQAVEQLWLKYRELFHEVYEHSRAHPINQSRTMGIMMLPDAQYEEAFKSYSDGYFRLNKAEQEELSNSLDTLLYVKKR